MGIGRRKVAIGAAAAAMVVALTAADRPGLFARASGGLWELDRGGGMSRRTRQCIGDPTILAQVEHRAVRCDRVVIRDQPTSAEVHYTCPTGGFGRTTIAMLTPRSFRIETQGISRGAPFHYVVQARRVGDCTIH